MSAQMDYMTLELMADVAATDHTFSEVERIATVQQQMMYLFQQAHIRELQELKEYAEETIAGRYEERYEDG